MNKNKGLFSLVGFILAGLGFSAIVLSLVGAKLSFLLWIDAFGALTGFVIKLVMILMGIVILYLARTDFSGEEEITE
ncbi:MAG: hypothetical protein GVY26_10640 [Bacteroidetes bacterium]|jgi:hypothetical protein|nr:hypothetical protein [Bacteroidota bacterium]